MILEVGQVDFNCLRELYHGNDTARAVLDHFASRERNWRVTSVDRIRTNIGTEGKELSRGSVITVFRELEQCGCGKFIVGRKGKQSRFEWKVQMVGVGQAAAGETEQVDEMSDEEAGEEEAESFVRHAYRLRPEVTIFIELPTDFTSQEAIRVARFVETLPFQVAR